MFVSLAQLLWRFWKEEMRILWGWPHCRCSRASGVPHRSASPPQCGCSHFWHQNARGDPVASSLLPPYTGEPFSHQLWLQPTRSPLHSIRGAVFTGATFGATSEGSCSLWFAALTMSFRKAMFLSPVQKSVST